MELLPIRMRPTTIDEIIGQTELLKQGSLLRCMIDNNRLTSIILYGPPGTGKTTIAYVIAKTTNAVFKEINAVQGSKKDIEAVCKDAEKRLANDPNDKTILFIDEIHRFNKAQQDYLLPFVENGVVTLIGATTENPYFEINHAIISRSKIFQLSPITLEDIETVVNRAVSSEKGLDGKFEISNETVHLIADQSNGDARVALNTLELASFLAESRNTNEITADMIKEILQKPNIRYDKDGDNHYDTISAFIKSMRGSDPDATIYYLARMIEAGEDPKFIARRIMIAAAEDVSNADPMALVVATSASLTVERIGMPEGRIALAQAALYIAAAPKSNSAITAIDSAMQYIRQHPSNDVPKHLRDAHYKSAAKLGHGVDYVYPHDYKNDWCPQQYLPDDVKEFFYVNSHNGYEAVQADHLNRIRNEYDGTKKS